MTQLYEIMVWYNRCVTWDRPSKFRTAFGPRSTVIETFESNQNIEPDEVVSSNAGKKTEKTEDFGRGKRVKKANRLYTKGVPARESRTGTRLVSPAAGCEKKN